MTDRPKVVALGGGHGLHAMLRALLQVHARPAAGPTTVAAQQLPDITAVVTVADDGGSSGRLRREMPGIVPPGDLRMALAALAGTDADGDLWARTFQHRFTGEGALTGHPVGNLVLVGLAQVLGDPIAALDVAGRLLGARGRVLPMSCQALDIVAEVEGLVDDDVIHDPHAVRRIRGQVAVASTPGRVRSVTLEPGDAQASPEAVRAILEADLVILGPGSWFTSVLPHLMLPGLAQALVDTAAHRLVVLNLAPQPGETEGFSPEQHLDVLSAHAPGFRIDTVLADTGAVALPGRLSAATAAVGARLVLARIADGSAPRHHPVTLAAALQPVLDSAVVSARSVRAGATNPTREAERTTTRPGRD